MTGFCHKGTQKEMRTGEGPRDLRGGEKLVADPGGCDVLANHLASPNRNYQLGDAPNQSLLPAHIFSRLHALVCCPTAEKIPG